MAIETDEQRRLDEDRGEEDGGGLDSSRGTRQENWRGQEKRIRVIDCVLGVASGTGKVFKVPLQGLNGAQFSFRLRRWI